MPKEIYLVKVGMSMTEGMVSEWYVADGAAVKKGELVYALETEKVNLDVDAEADGIVKHAVEPGVMLAPGDVVGYIYLAGETVPEGALSGQAGSPDANTSSVEIEAPSVAPAPVLASASAVQAVAEPGLPDGRLKSSPAARRLASELNVSLAMVRGSGPGGRIIERDVQAASASSASMPSQPVSRPAQEVLASPLAKRMAAERGLDLALISGSGPNGRIIQADIEAQSNKGSSGASKTAVASGSEFHPGQRIPLKGMRRTIATRMYESLQETAQLSMDMTATMDDAVRLRSQLVKEWEGVAKPTYTDLVIRAVAKALRLHPQMNSQYQDDSIELMRDVHVGLAVAVPEGLLVPVIRDADQRSLQDIAIESARLATAARAGALGLDDYAGGTFTVSALGMFGVNSFTPIINRPQSGILGVNQIYDGLSWDGETPVRTKQMNLSLTWDHRVLDGAPAAEFLATVVELLSEPYRLLV